MYDFRKFYINGEWVSPSGRRELDVINPATEQPVGKILLGTAEDVDAAVKAARAAFESFSQTTREERVALLERIIKTYQGRLRDIAVAISDEMGAPMKLALNAQAASGLGHFATTLAVLKDFEFEEMIGTTQIRREPVGVCGLITPWNWPINQISCKVAPALAAGCTVVLKPSEIAPLSAHLFAEVLAEAGVPRGVFNLVTGDGPTVGEAMARHPDVDMISFTGSTRAGRLVSQAASETVKRVALELGGKSPNVILDDADLEQAVVDGIGKCYLNSGQTCSALTRMLVPREKLEAAEQIAAAVVNEIKVGDPFDPDVTLGPLASEAQLERVRGYIKRGQEEGAKLVAGGDEPPEGAERGYFVQPTVFSEVDPKSTIAQEEIFGPVLSIIPYESEDEAVQIANDSMYGLAGGVWSGDEEHAKTVARRIRTGQIEINGATFNPLAPFGGFKQSGHGRELGKFGLEEFLEIKSLQL